MKIKLLALLAIMLCSSATYGASVSERVMASRISGIKTPSVSLNGTWEFRLSPQSKWASIEVPGEAVMQGFAVEYDKPMEYKRSFKVPADFAGQSTILRFDGVYNNARLWVNDHFVREHFGGFTRWEADITQFIKVGENNHLRLEVVDPMDEISYASGYAHHPIGGILRGVTLYSAPSSTITNLAIQTLLDSTYTDAQLVVSYSMENEQKAKVSYTLTAPNGELVAIKESSREISKGVNSHTFSLSNPAKWDAEHPNLYRLNVKVSESGGRSYEFSRQIGFRKIEVKGAQLLVNGHAVKLRGACRHDIHPTLGRTTTRELDSLDVMLFKQSNMNFVRTSHYPPSEAFVEFCDRYGIYVECETAVCFVDTHRIKDFAPVNTQSNPNYTDRYLSQCQEMIRTFNSSASIVLWSIGNESAYGTNFQLCYDWVKNTDQTRPVIFSYPGLTPKDMKVYDILSMHYQDSRGNLWQYGMSTSNFQGHGIPALFDEWAHPACYTYKTLRDDPNIREFWGRSLDMMWSGLFDSPGGLGGAIWGYIDESFMVPTPKEGVHLWKDMAYLQKAEHINDGNCVGYGQWGIVDVWRRLKPEFWSTKKAYSPVRLMELSVANVSPAQSLVLAVYNRFDHTNLSEIKLRYTYDGQSREMNMPSVEPHQKGVVVIPSFGWRNESQLFVEFLTADGQLIDAEMVSLGGKVQQMVPIERNRGELVVDQSTESIIVKGDGFVVPFDRATGLITNATVNGQVVIERGPFLNLDVNLNHLSGAEVRRTANNYQADQAQWTLGEMRHEVSKHGVEFFVSGKYGTVELEFHISIDNKGTLSVDYRTIGEPNGFVRQSGLMFEMPKSVDRVEWNRRGYWSYYPKGEFAGNQGSFGLYESNQSAYGAKPTQPWHLDTHDYFYWADAGANCSKPLTMAAKGLKENIYDYALSDKGGKGMLKIISNDGSVACRLSKNSSDRLRLYVNNRWDYPEIAWGNYCKQIEAYPNKGSFVINL